MKKFLTVVTLITSILLTGCGNATPNETDSSASNKDSNTTVNSEVDTTESETTTTETSKEDVNTEKTTEETPEEPVVVYADWIDALHAQMIGLDFNSVIATISQSDFVEKCSIYETRPVSPAYENHCYRLPVSTGGEIGIVSTSSETTIFFCPGDTDDHMSHRGGFECIGYGDIAVVYSGDGTVTCDGIHVKSSKRSQSSFDMEPGGIWIVWCI